MIARIRIALLLPVAAILLAGCASAATQLNADGSGQFEVSLHYSADDVSAFARTPGNESKSICDRANSYKTLGHAFTESPSSGTCSVVQSFRDLGELRTIYGQFTPISVNRLEATGCRYIYDVDVQLPADGLKQFDWEVIWPWPGFMWFQNADEGPGPVQPIGGRVLKWHLYPGSNRNMHVESLDLRTLPCFGAYVILPLAAIGLALVGGAWGLLSWNRRRRSSPRVMTSPAAMPKPAEPTLRRRWVVAFTCLGVVLFPVAIVLLGLTIVVIRFLVTTIYQYGLVSGASAGIMFLSILLLVLSLLPVTYYILVFGRWYAPWRKYVLLVIEVAPLALLAAAVLLLLYGLSHMSWGIM